MAEFNTKGAAELDKALQGFSAKVERNIMRGALRAGAKVFEQDAKARVPYSSGDLRDSIRVSVRVRAGQIMARVIAGGKKAWYAHMVEKGTKPHEIRPKGEKSLFFAGLFSRLIQHPGAKAQPFMKPAFDEKAQSAIDKVADYARVRIDKEAKKK